MCRWAALSVAILIALPLQAQSVSGGGCTVTQARLVLGAPFNINVLLFLQMQCPETSWIVSVRNTDRGLQVGPAWLQRTPNGDWLKVLKEANVADNITVYHNGSHLNDTQFANAANAIPTLNASDLAPGGMLVALNNETTPRAAVELRSRGLSWLCTWNLGPSISRRGMEMAIWGIWDTGNYDYIIEYSFRDDGQISFRAGASGWNNTTEGTDVPHTHDLLWRVDIDLGSGVNTPYMWTHEENSFWALDHEDLFNFGFEGAADLDPEKFARLIIEDRQTVNGRQHHPAYELQPLRAGVGRHLKNSEEWTLHDVWVTRYQAAETAAAIGTGGWRPPDEYLLGNQTNGFGVYNHEPTVDQDLVVWHITSTHHEPHDEDQSSADPSGTNRGITLLHWSGFDLVPHDVFDANPLGGPDRTLCNGPQ